MDIANERAHRLLSYIAAVSDESHDLTAVEFEEYARHPDLRTSPPLGASPMMMMQALVTRRESHLDWLVRIHWVEADEPVRLTPLGRAVLRSLDKAETREDHPTHVLLGAHDPLSYARLLETIAGAGEALLVDPYFRLEQLQDIAQHTRVTRILTSKRIGEDGRTGLAAGLAVIGEDRSLAIRVGAEDAMHDRYLIPPAGQPVRMLGSSLNTVESGRLTMLAEISEPAADEARARYEQTWREATPIEPLTRSPETSET